MSTHLTAEQLQELTNELYLELQRLGGRSGSAAHDLTARALANGDAPIGLAMAGTGAESTAGPPDDLANEFDAARDGRAPERLLRTLEALSRIRTGRYGTCARCRAPIPFGRLLALPDTTSCVQCARKHTLVAD